MPSVDMLPYCYRRRKNAERCHEQERRGQRACRAWIRLYRLSVRSLQRGVVKRVVMEDGFIRLERGEIFEDVLCFRRLLCQRQRPPLDF